MRKIQSVLSKIVLIGAMTVAVLNAQDACIALLQYGIYDTHVSKSSAQSY